MTEISFHIQSQYQDGFDLLPLVSKIKTFMFGKNHLLCKYILSDRYNHIKTSKHSTFKKPIKKIGHSLGNKARPHLY